MLDVISPVSDIFSSVYIPLTKEIIQHTLNRLGLAKSIGPNINIRSIGTAVSSSSSDDGTPNLLRNRLDVEAHFSNASGDQPWDTASTMLDQQQSLPHLANFNIKPIFIDPSYQFTIREYERTISFALTCVLHYDDLVGAIAALQRIRSLTTTGVLMSDFHFVYFLPPAIYIRLYQLFKLTGGEDTNFIPYLEQWSGSRICRSSNRHDPSKKGLVVRKNKAGIIQKIECGQGEPAPEGSEASPNSYAITFNLTTQMSLPNLVGIQYPIVVNNELVPKELIPIAQEEAQSPPVQTHPYFSLDKYYEEIATNRRSIKKDPYHIPWYDSWTPPTRSLLSRYVPFFISVVLMDDPNNEDAVTSVDLETDLIPELIPDIIETLKTQGESSKFFTTSKVNVCVFANDVMIEPSSIVLEGGTKLTFPNRLKSAIYRLVLSSTEFVVGKNTQLRIINADIISNKR